MDATRRIALLLVSILSLKSWGAKESVAVHSDSKVRTVMKKHYGPRIRFAFVSQENYIAVQWPTLPDGAGKTVWVYVPANVSHDSILNYPMWWALLTMDDHHPHFITKQYCGESRWLEYSEENNWGCDFHPAGLAIASKAPELLREFGRQTRWDAYVENLPKSSRFQRYYNDHGVPDIYGDLSEWLTDLFTLLTTRNAKSFDPNVLLREKIREEIETTAQAMREKQDLSLLAKLTGSGLDPRVQDFVLFTDAAMKVTKLATGSCSLAAGAVLSLKNYNAQSDKIEAVVEDQFEDSDGKPACENGDSILLSGADGQNLMNNFLELLDETLELSRRTWFPN